MTSKDTVTPVPSEDTAWDAVVVGAGFGGLATALTLAEGGAKVLVCETLKYPGGCASTFEHKGFHFEAGATLFSGFDEGQLFHRWIDRWDLDVEVVRLDPTVELRTPSWRLEIPPNREDFLARVVELPGVPRERLLAFLGEQEQIADALWPVLDDPTLLPPLSFHNLFHHVRQLPKYLPLLRFLGRSLEPVMRRHGLDDCDSARVYLDALCQITLQGPHHAVEAPFALSAMDYYFRGTGHVRGGIGRLAWGLVDAIRRAGGEVRFTDRVRTIQPERGSFTVETRHGRLKSRTVVANVLPTALRQMVTNGEGGSPLEGHKDLDALDRGVRSGWGACMLYRVAPAPPGASSHAHHLELIQDPSAPFIEGNHLFCSISGDCEGGQKNNRQDCRAPNGYRTMTVSTHVELGPLLELTPKQQGRRVAAIQQRMRDGLATLAPEWNEDVLFEATASPRTFERFTGRTGGFVGGIPRRAGLHGYRRAWPTPILPGLYMVGDSIFPGQSTLGVASGGVQVARKILRDL